MGDLALQVYQSRYRCTFVTDVGAGIDGAVLMTDAGRAVKFHTTPSNYRREKQL
jgi:hypothetical protein